MTIYLRTDDRRLPLDPAEVTLSYDDIEFKLDVTVLDMYDMAWSIADGTLGEEVPCKVLRLDDPASGLALEMPIALEVAGEIATGLMGPDNGRPRGLRLWKR